MIQVSTRFIPPSGAALPALAVQTTRLDDAFIVWVGVTTETAETVADAPRSGSLCKDWAYAMPPSDAHTATATTLYRTSNSSDVALAMAQRLAKRVRKPVFLSVDITSTFEGTRLVLDAEKAVVEELVACSW